MKTKTAKQIYKNGKGEDLTKENVFEIILNLYNKNLAEVWFIGMGWPEGYHYCKNSNYLDGMAMSILKTDFRAVWFACKFLD